jgi:DNA-binding GntR family transcriptional regulator
VDAADNAVLSSLYASVNQRIRRSRFVAPMTEEHWRLAVLEHEAMLNCLERRDGAAIAIIMKRHLRHKQQQAAAAGFARDDEAAPVRGPRRKKRDTSAQDA